jgi:hypothetical protein
MDRRSLVSPETDAAAVDSAASFLAERPEIEWLPTGSAQGQRHRQDDRSENGPERVVVHGTVVE